MLLQSSGLVSPQVFVLVSHARVRLQITSILETVGIRCTVVHPETFNCVPSKGSDTVFTFVVAQEDRSLLPARAIQQLGPRTRVLVVAHAGHQPMDSLTKYAITIPMRRSELLDWMNACVDQVEHPRGHLWGRSGDEGWRRECGFVKGSGMVVQTPERLFFSIRKRTRGCQVVGSILRDRERTQWCLTVAHSEVYDGRVEPTKQGDNSGAPTRVASSGGPGPDGTHTPR